MQNRCSQTEDISTMLSTKYSLATHDNFLPRSYSLLLQRWPCWSFGQQLILLKTSVTFVCGELVSDVWLGFLLMSKLVSQN